MMYAPAVMSKKYGSVNAGRRTQTNSKHYNRPATILPTKKRSREVSIATERKEVIVDITPKSTSML